MPWEALQEVREKESALQAVFDSWGPQVSTGQLAVNEHVYLIAGAPAWLPVHVQPVIDLKLSKAEGRPDFVWKSNVGSYVIELKSADKGEPLALAQVLHYTHALNRGQLPTPVIPVMVTQYNSWLRESLSHLFEHGLQRDALRYLDFAILKLRGRHGRRLISFGEPFASWVRLEHCPAELRVPLNQLDEIAHPLSHWYYMEATSTWIAMERAIDLPHRPGIMGQPYTMITRMHDGMYLQWTEEGDGGEYLWQAEQPAAERTVARIMSPRLANPATADHFKMEVE